MANALVPLEKLQFGIETTPGTLVAADTVLIAENGGEYEEHIERVLIEEERGVLGDVEDVDVMKATRLEVAGALDFEQVLLPLLTGLKSTTPVNGGVGVEAWTFTPSMTAPETLKAATFEVAYTDGSTKHVEREFGYGTCKGFGIDFAFNQPAKLKSSYFARAAQSSTFTTGQSALARQVIGSNQFGVYIDTTWAGLGGTQKSGLIRSGGLEITTGAEPDFTLDARSDLDFSQLIRGLIRGSLKLNMAVDANFATEMTAYRDKTMRFIQLKALGTASRSFIVNLAGIYTAPPKFGRQGGMRVGEMTLGLRRDATSGNLLSFVVTNALAGF